MKILNSKFIKWFFHRYFDIPKEKEIFQVGKNFIDYWEDKEKGIAKRKDYGQPLMRINPWVGILSEPEIGATNTSSVNNKDNLIDQVNPTSNYGTSPGFASANDATLNNYYRTLIHFTLSSGSGSISAVKLYLYKYADVSGYTCPAVEVHELSRTDWTEDGSTWNNYKASTAWTTAGGDFSSTIVDTTNSPLSQGSYGWEDWDLGTGATNAISGLTWGSEVHLLLKHPQAASKYYTQWYSRDNASNKPYIEITYTPATGTNMKINIGDTFKDVSEMKINIGDSWKSVTQVKINVGDVWKDVF